MAIKKFIKVVDFCESFGVGYVTLNSRKSVGALPHYIFNRPKKSQYMYIDYNYFVRRQAFRRQLQMFNQEMYYFLTVYLQLSESEISRTISTLYGVEQGILNVWINSSLFKTRDKITDIRLGKYEWAFNKFCRLLLRDINRTKSYKFDIKSVELVLDKEM